MLPTHPREVSGDSVICGDNECGSNAYCDQTEDGRKTCRCNLGYTDIKKGCVAGMCCHANHVAEDTSKIRKCYYNFFAGQ